jgi:lipoate-protein ligase A
MRGLAILDQPRAGVENMALDEQMLARAAISHHPLLRVYRWARPTLSLGYFQRAVDRSSNPESLNIELVRRSTGGGAIVHHYDWTYSLAIPTLELNRDWGLGASHALYDVVHSAVVGWLIRYAVPARQADEADVRIANNRRFLCFERRSVGDIVAAGYKIMGSAQRRSRGALLQHGSLLLSRSPHAPSLPGIAELAAEV